MKAKNENGDMTWQWVEWFFWGLKKLARMTGHFCKCQLNGTPDPHNNGLGQFLVRGSRWVPKNLNGVKADEFVSLHLLQTHTEYGIRKAENFSTSQSSDGRQKLNKFNGQQ